MTAIHQHRNVRVPLLFLLAALCAGHAGAETTLDAAPLAMDNPYTAGTTLPFIMNFDHGYGPDDRTGYQFNFQPVIPIAVNDDWHVIARTIAIFRFHDAVYDDSVTGPGDITQTFFLSPTKATDDGFSWGMGPAFLIPTAGDPRLGSQDWGAGLTSFGLVQRNGWFFGVLAHHLWSTDLKSSAADYSRTFVQPYVSYAIGSGQTISLTIEGTYDWDAGQWTAPMNLGYTKMFEAGNNLVGFYVGAKFYVQAPDNGPEIGLRTALILAFPD